MNLYVVDASVAAKWFFEEIHAEASQQLLEDRYYLHAPDFFLMEIDSLLCKRIRRKEINEREGQKIRAALRQFPIQYHPFQNMLDLAYEIANRTGHSVYDCLYIALAALLQGQMVTADRRLYDGLAHGPFARYVRWVSEE